MNIKAYQKGFTIVELLIVVVVIAILAAISTVAYSGVTNRAKKSSALSAATSVQKVADAYLSTNGVYPALKSDFVSGGPNGVTKLPSDIIFKQTNPLATDDPKTVSVLQIYVGTKIVGFVVRYFDATINTTATINIGDTSYVGATLTQMLPNNT